MSQKNPVKPLGIDPGTVRLVAQLLNHYATPGPIPVYTVLKYIVKVWWVIYITGLSSKSACTLPDRIQ
jgi:hypothetical protein